MFIAQLFMGVVVEGPFAAQFSAANPQLVALFLSPDREYLLEIQHEGKRYLGKTVSKSTDLASLEQMEANIVSLLRKIVPEYAYDQMEMVIFPLVETKGK
jgi:hypothetical protein